MSEPVDDEDLPERGPGAAADGEAVAVSAPPVVVARWIQLVVLPLGALALYAVARAAGVVLLLFLTAGVIALVLTPVVAALQRSRLPRGAAIFVVYAGFFVSLTIVAIVLSNPIADQVSSFQRDVPSIVDSANESLDELQASLDERGIDIEVKEQGQSALGTLQERVIGGTDRIVSFGTDLLARLITAGFGLVLVFVLSIYMLFYGERIGVLARAVMPPGDGTPRDDYPTRVVRGVAGYVRGQVLFCLAMGTGAGLGLYVLGLVGVFPEGQTYALAFGAWFGLMELVPYIGPFLGAAPPVLIALFQDPLTAVWVSLLFVGLQQIEGHVVAPLVFGHALRINPLLVIFALLFGGELYGIVGALIALPIAAVLRETVGYLSRHLVLEPWGTSSPLSVAGAAGLPPPARRCPECAAVAAAPDAYCRSCGAALDRTEVASGR